ncbi:MAG: hypothetical protein ACR5LF_02375 [Symbiopectobacterium sp.]
MKSQTATNSSETLSIANYQSPIILR